VHARMATTMPRDRRFGGASAAPSVFTAITANWVVSSSGKDCCLVVVGSSALRALRA
jgi:hypothetical protein